MAEFFNFVVGAIETALTFLYNMINALLLAYDAIFTAVSLSTNLALILPGILGSAVLITVSLGVVKFIVGR